MKKTKVLIPALSILALGMAASVTGTVAWFTATAKAKAEGIAVKTIVPSSMFIDNQFHAVAEGNALTLDTITYEAAATQLDPIHMDKTNIADTNKRVEAVKPSAYSTQPTQSNPGVASAYADIVGSIALGTDDGLPTITQTNFANYALALEQSIVTKKTGADAQSYTLGATVSVSGIATTGTEAKKANERLAYLTLRSGFLYTSDGGSSWSFVGQAKNGETFNDGDTARPGALSEGAASFSEVQIGSAHYNSVVCVVPVFWLEGSDSNAYANRFQDTYNWTIEVSYRAITA